MVDYTFTAWERRRRKFPESERLLPLLRAAGSLGMTRRQIGSAVRLDRDVLDQLLDGMVGASILILSRDARGPVYRATAV
jgi:hypothetical protein